MFAEKVEIEKRTNVFLEYWGTDGAGVEPTDEELEGKVVGVGETVCFRGGRGVRFFVVKPGAKEGGVIAEELFVEDPMGVFGADVDVYEGGREESGDWVSECWENGGRQEEITR